jgi:hypothetical protein
MEQLYRRRRRKRRRRRRGFYRAYIGTHFNVCERNTQCRVHYGQTVKVLGFRV